MQRRIVTPGPLHDENGRLIETGYATELIKTYDRSRIAARPGITMPSAATVSPWP